MKIEFNFVPSKNSYYFVASSGDLDTRRRREVKNIVISDIDDRLIFIVIRGDEISCSIFLEESAPINNVSDGRKGKRINCFLLYSLIRLDYPIEMLNPDARFMYVKTLTKITCIYILFNWTNFCFLSAKGMCFHFFLFFFF